MPFRYDPGMTIPTDHRLWQQAVSCAARAHQGQLRKDGKTPYFAHPVRVALTVRHVFGVDDPAALVIALLHDVIEDTTVDYDELLELFGAEVAAGVAALTKDARLPERDRELAYDAQLRQASWQAKLVKLADVHDNFCDSAGADQTKILGKAKRALAIAGDTSQLQAAAAIVRRLIDPEG